MITCSTDSQQHTLAQEKPNILVLSNNSGTSGQTLTYILVQRIINYSY